MAGLRQVFGVLAVVLALAGQIGCAAALEPDGGWQSSLAALDAATILCQGAHHDDGDGPRRHHAVDPAIVQASAAAALHAAILDSAPAYAPPAVRSTLHAGLSQARAPPALFLRAAYPRGPPRLS
jgi:hypothetical protein